jgi:undecaprenyl-diphosphatase
LQTVNFILVAIPSVLNNLVSCQQKVLHPMNDVISAIVLGIVQGLTEFLPVSSSGHLELAEFLMSGAELKDHGIIMTVVLHFATALSTVIIFRKDVLEILKGLFQFQPNEQFFFSVKILISMVPAVIVGLLFEDQLEQLFDQRIVLVGCMLLVTGVLLLLADRAKNTDSDVGFVGALIIGISQAIAILPGISRSGATISTSVLLGIDRAKAARFSFLMVVPLIFGKIAKDILDYATGGGSQIAEVNFLALAIGFVAAFVTGLLACTWMLKLVKACKLFYFSIYCFAVAAWAICAGAGVF